MIRFNPFEVDPKESPLKVGKEYVLVENYFYCNKEDLEEETAEDYLKIMELERWGDLYIPSGTIMEFKGFDFNGWPTFVIKGEELDFAGDLDMLLLEVR